MWKGKTAVSAVETMAETAGIPVAAEIVVVVEIAAEIAGNSAETGHANRVRPLRGNHAKIRPAKTTPVVTTRRKNYRT